MKCHFEENNLIKNAKRENFEKQHAMNKQIQQLMRHDSHPYKENAFMHTLTYI